MGKQRKRNFLNITSRAQHFVLPLHSATQATTEPEKVIENLNSLKNLNKAEPASHLW